MNSSNTSHQRRPSLSEQIDRLDGILDGLADGLNEAVAGAVRGAVLAAVREAITAILNELQTNAELQARLLASDMASRAPSAPSAGTPARPSWLRRKWDAVRGVVMATTAMVSAAVSRAYQAIAGWLGLSKMVLTQALAMVWENRVTVTLALVGGLAASVFWLHGSAIAFGAWAGVSSTVAVLLLRTRVIWNWLAEKVQLVLV